jgi:uncharacterized protein
MNSAYGAKLRSSRRNKLLDSTLELFLDPAQLTTEDKKWLPASVADGRGERLRRPRPASACQLALQERLAGAHTGAVRITIRVRPGSTRPGVGGERDGALVVRVSGRAVDGQATAAALAAVAAAFGVRRHEVTLIAGTSSRTKIVDVQGADPSALDRLLHP